MKKQKVYNPAVYVEQRDKMIADILNLVHQAYPNDTSLKSGVVDLTVELQVAPIDQKMVAFIDGMRGFMMWAGENASNRPGAGSVLSTLIHDLAEFARNRHEKWFCPRTTGYQKYLSGASGVTV
jgi:hypothetical protein